MKVTLWFLALVVLLTALTKYLLIRANRRVKREDE